MTPGLVRLWTRLLVQFTRRPRSSPSSIPKRRPMWSGVSSQCAAGPETSTGTGIARLWPNGPRAWVSFQGQQTELNASSGGADARLSGVLAGADGTLGERWFAGVGGGYTTGDLSLDGRV